MATPIDQLLSRTIYTTDGATTVWDFSFASGYLDSAHVKAYTETAVGVRTVVTGTLIGAYQLQITPALVAGDKLVIYRDTPKNAPLVDFTDESGFSEIALDTNAKQAVFIAAEGADELALTDVSLAILSAESAGVSAEAAAASELAAAASVTAAANLYDSFDDRYLGAKATAPALDNDGNALLVGAIYFDTVIAGGAWRAWGGSAWITAPVANASLVVNTPSGSISATTVQAAINELATEKLNASAVSTFAATLLDDATAAAARTTLGAAASGALGSSGITGAAASGANSDITSLTGLTTALSVAQGGTGATTAAAAFTAIKQEATDTSTGVVELATAAEVRAGTDTSRAVTPAGVASAAIGAGQTWQDVTVSRAAGTTYTNSTGKPIQVAISCTGTQSQNATLVVGGVSVMRTGVGASNVGWLGNVSGIVPAGTTYYLTVSGAAISFWSELR